MNKKVVFFASVIFFLGILSINSLATNYYTPNKFKIGTGDHEFTWNIYTEYDISRVEVTTPKDIDVTNKTTNNRNVTIDLESNDLSRGIYIVTATVKFKTRAPDLTYTAPIMVDIATKNQINNLEDDVEDINDKIDKVENSLNSDIDDIEEKIDDVEDDVGDLESRINSVKNSGSKRKEEIMRLDEDLNQLSTKLKNLKEDLSETESNLKNVKSTTSTGMVFTSASLGVGVLVLVILILYLGFKKGLFKNLMKTFQQTYKEKVQKKEPWER